MLDPRGKLIGFSSAEARKGWSSTRTSSEGLIIEKRTHRSTGSWRWTSPSRIYCTDQHIHHEFPGVLVLEAAGEKIVGARRGLRGT
jgi:hypothetical protein